MNLGMAISELSKLISSSNVENNNNIDTIHEKIITFLNSNNIVYDYVYNECIAKEIVKMFINEGYYANYNYLGVLNKYEIVVSRIKTLSMKLSYN